MRPMLRCVLCAVPFVVTACEVEGSVATGDHPLHEAIDPADAVLFDDVVGLDADRALELAYKFGVEEEEVVYVGTLPEVVSETEARSAIGVLTRQGEDLLVTRFDSFTAEPIDLEQPLPPNLVDFALEIGLDDPGVSYGTTPGTYDNPPWGWHLPFGATGAAWMTCGYGCGYHTGLDAYATDWDPGNAGHAVQAPASCFVMSTSYSSSYGWQVIGECGDAGNGRRWLFRASHLRSASTMQPGWWVWRDRRIGDMGRTGTATGDHIHFVVYQGNVSGSSISGNSVPMSRWPSVNDSVCNGDLRSFNFSGSTMRNIGAVRSNGCR
jgi:murein DD-endopeptidase MepM/ murein hydrolase activator NlpD